MNQQQTTAAGGDDSRVEQALSQMTLEEKAALTVGRDAWTTQPVERLGVPSVWVSDGPTGLRKVPTASSMGLGAIPATCFPTASALGASWDVDLLRDVGGAVAAECQAADVQVLLAPGINLKRSPLCGRNFEYFAEDPVLAGELAAAFVGGLQENGVGGCLKHLVANESETDRMITSSEVDERTLRELYLRPFEIAVEKADPWTLMAAYNRLNGVYCAENAHLLRDIVAGEWGYQGIIMSDWLAVNDRAAGIAAGLHLQMPAAPTAVEVVAAVREGRLDEARLDAIVRALLRFVFRADADRRPGSPVDFDAHHRLARRAAAESVVLLKNSAPGGESPLLPLTAAAGGIALIGAFAREPRYQGAGSSQVTPVGPVENIHDEL
ncbi:MAG TPA: glycoside hydrolase family 3 N-terminal domain-containing protein, partial [Chloroflexia bacterium]|nr:glycoside hydrolase family 3 N-terminal domain-containing protein [Chloroflexia bacterium]